MAFREIKRPTGNLEFLLKKSLIVIIIKYFIILQIKPIYAQ